MTQPIMTLTDNAVSRVKMMLGEAKEPVLGIRVGVKSGGCSGMSYFIEYATAQNPMEDVVENGGVKVFIDPMAVMYLVGTEMDYMDSDMQSGFVFRNPNEAGRCGCGKSFKVN